MEATPHSHKLQLVAGVAFGVVVAGALLFGWQDLRNSIVEQDDSSRERVTKLDRRIGELESRLTTLEAAPRTDSAALDTIRTDITALQTTAAHLQESLTALENKPAVVVAEPVKAEAPNSAPLAALTTAIQSGSPYQAELDAWLKAHPNKQDAVISLRAKAAYGLPTEAGLREQFTSIVSRLDSGDAADAGSPPIISRINTHLAGLVSIRKASDHRAEYATLRGISDGPLEQIAAKVSALPDDAQAPFSNWRNDLKTRADALAELATLPQDKTP